MRRESRSTLFPYTTLFRSRWGATDYPQLLENWKQNFFGWNAADFGWGADRVENILWRLEKDRKSTRLNSSHRCISYAVFCLKKKTKQKTSKTLPDQTLSAR